MKVLGYIIIVIAIFGAGYLTTTDVNWIVPTAVGIGGLLLGGYVASQD